MKTQTEALRLFTNQLLDCDGKPNGVHVGCDDLEICKNSYLEGEMSPAIHEWVDAAELRRLSALNGELLEALKLALPQLIGHAERTARAAFIRARGHT
jgi:hypothetical protein